MTKVSIHGRFGEIVGKTHQFACCKLSEIFSALEANTGKVKSYITRNKKRSMSVFVDGVAVQEKNFNGGNALRIGIFLSIFDTHINRAPCNAKIENITYKEGKYKNAANPKSGQTNESNDLALTRIDNPKDRLIVRQISGSIARRIVCDASQGQLLTGGQKFGMIKFGSRTELYVPQRENMKCIVKVGDKVKAGLTTLVRYEGNPIGGRQL